MSRHTLFDANRDLSDVVIERFGALKNVPARTMQGMKFPDAPYTLKMACGENPKRVYGYGGGRFPGGAPYSRMGNVAGYRMAWAKAVEYKRKWEKYEEEGGTAPVA